MSSPLYTTDILRLATQCAAFPPLPDANQCATARSPVCGSVLTLSAHVTGGVIDAVGLAMTSCAIGQASAALFARSAKGRGLAELAAAAPRVERWLAEGGEEPWPGFATIESVRDYPARHGAVLLPFRAAAQLREIKDA